jgi:NAD(P)-dependent dehydrogenase (short-subunit alcohol dehydrogenase family)
MGKSGSKVILIVGASGGFGQAFVRRLVQDGYRVFGTSRHPKEFKTNHLKTYQGSFQMLEMNVDSSLSVQKALKQVLKIAGQIDVVINSVGYSLAGSIEDTSIEEVQQTFNTNFFGIHRVCQQVIPVMRKQGEGKIINISSLIGLVGIPFQGFYAATKYALEGYTEALRLELEPFNIKVSLVEPGDFNTPLTDHRKIAKKCQQSSVYWQRFSHAIKEVEKAERKGESPEKLADLIEKIIKSPSPRLRYRIGPSSTIIGLKPLIPEAIALRLISKYYG